MAALRRLLILGALCCAASMLCPLSASAQDDVDALWTRYEEDSTQFIELQSQCDAGNIEATTTNRICRQAVDAGFQYADTIDALLAADGTLLDDERAALVDGLLTTRQIAASIMVDLGQCQEAVPVLDGLLLHPGTPERPVLEEAVQRWLDNANICIERQEDEARRAVAVDATDAPTPTEGANVTGPVLLMAGGGALVVGGFVWDAAMASERSAFDRELDDCRTSAAACDQQRLDDAKQNIEGARVPIATLVGVGAATAVGGVVWYVVERRSARADDVAVRIRPTRLSDGSRSYYGVRLNARF